MKRSRAHTRATGFTLIEMLCAVTILGILSSLAYPSYQHVVHKVRRSDALVAIMQVQAAQERYRADHAAYGSLTDIGLSGTSATGHYRIVVSDTGPTGYQIRAQAGGPQQADRDCRYLKLVIDGSHMVRASGRDADVTNGEAVNRRCWGL